HRVHDRRKTGQRSGAQVVAVRKASGNDDGIVTAQVGVAVPDEINRLSDVFRDHVVSIVIAVRAGKNNDAEFHSSVSSLFGVRRLVAALVLARLTPRSVKGRN